MLLLTAATAAWAGYLYPTAQLTHTHNTYTHRTHTVTRLDNISNRLISQETKNYNRKINTEKEAETDRMRKPN